MNRACVEHPQDRRLHHAARALRLTVLIGLLLAHRDVLAQQSEPQPCLDSTPSEPAPSSGQRRPELQVMPEARPSLVGPLLLSFAGSIVAVGSLAVGANNRPLCFDGCSRSIPTPYLVAAAVGGGATVVGAVWLIARLIAGSAYDKRTERSQAALRRYGFELQLTPTIASAHLNVSF